MCLTACQPGNHNPNLNIIQMVISGKMEKGREDGIEWAALLLRHADILRWF